jgi:hypothetical protein
MMRAVILLGLLVPACLAAAQTASPDGKIHTQIEGISIPAIPDAPFTAKVTVMWDEPLVGGGTLSRKYYTMVARDSQGRVHREIRDFVPSTSNAEPRLRSFIIADPVAGTSITCLQDGFNCTVLDFHAPRALTTSTASHGNAANRQSLGEQTMNALPVVGSREISTTGTGVRGNSRILVSSKELWYSPDLKMNLSVIRKDPQLGQVTLTVTDLTRGEPDPTWFGVPGGYKIVDARTSPAEPQ